VIWWAWNPYLNLRPRPASTSRIVGIVVILVVMSPLLSVAWSVVLLAISSSIPNPPTLPYSTY
jgi:hypothetical protein